MDKVVRYPGIMVTVRPATLYDGVVRDVLISRLVESTQPDELTQTIGLVYYPACVACSSLSLMPADCSEDVNVGQRKVISLESFMGLPDEFVRAWVEVVQEINPHWSGSRSAVEIAEKKRPEMESEAG